MNKAWIAVSLTAIGLVGCKSETEPVSQVPPPNYAAEPEPLPPVSINQGSPDVAGSGDTPTRSTVGPTTGPGNYEPEPLPLQPVSRTYTIRKGDTFWSIAQRQYGDGQKWRDISAANPSVDPKKLAVGQQITLP